MAPVGRRMDDSGTFRSGYVAMIGRPNVGKSTLLNAYLGQPVAAVSRKPQTTRTNQLGILTLPSAQIIFVDTPGIHRPHHKLGQQMNEVARRALGDADVLLVLYDLSVEPTEDDRRVAERVGALGSGSPVVIALNKIDLISPGRLQAAWSRYESLTGDAAAVLAISATRGDGRQELLEEIQRHLPPGPKYFPEEQITDLYEREIAADLIRAAALELLRQEVPHGIAVTVDEFKERDGDGAYISATLYLARKSHKGIVIGKGGQMIREIGSLARKGIEGMSGRKVFLELRVKVLPGWQNEESALKRFGYTRNSS